MDSRFSNFTERERDLLRMSLRRFYDDMERACLSGIAEPDSKLSEVSALYFELMSFKS